MRDPANLNTCAIVFQAVFQLPLDSAIVLRLFHVDEVDHHETRKIPEAQLSGDFFPPLRGSSEARCPSMLCSRVDLPEFTSIETRASVWLMTIYPPDLSVTCGENIASSWGSTPYRMKSGEGSR